MITKCHCCPSSILVPCRLSGKETCPRCEKTVDELMICVQSVYNQSNIKKRNCEPMCIKCFLGRTGCLLSNKKTGTCYVCQANKKSTEFLRLDDDNEINLCFHCAFFNSVADNIKSRACSLCGNGFLLSKIKNEKEYEPIQADIHCITCQQTINKPNHHNGFNQYIFLKCTKCQSPLCFNCLNKRTRVKSTRLTSIQNPDIRWAIIYLAHNGVSQPKEISYWINKIPKGEAYHAGNLKVMSFP